MTSDLSSFYARWRKERAPVWELREVAKDGPPEVLLQHIWARQRLKREQLTTTNGEPLTILHPGFWNREAGPDFSQAIVRIGDQKTVHGDIEIDRSTSGWKDHGHDRNPNFKNTVLHVVWDVSKTAQTNLPTLVLKGFLDAPIGELYDLLDGGSPPPLPDQQQGKCSAPLQQMDATELEELLNSAARVRLEFRACQIRARAKQMGWEQALIEGMLRGLGYKNNSWPMQCLGEISSKIRADSSPENPFHWQAILLGIGGLLPDQLRREGGGTDTYLKTVWNVWWRVRNRFESLVLPKQVWRLSGVRPANHPQRRLALAAHWLSDDSFFSKLESWFAEISEGGGGKAVSQGEALLKILNPKKDLFWQHHWTLGSKPMELPQPLLGSNRVSDLVVNVVLPWFFTRAAEGKNLMWKEKAEGLWLSWLKAEDNALLRQARARLLGNAGPGILKTAAHQQGLLQIVRDYCDQSNAICEECRFPILVSDWLQLNHANQ